eukprot:768744-Hanusia_phi.AAC.9
MESAMEVKPMIIPLKSQIYDRASRVRGGGSREQEQTSDGEREEEESREKARPSGRRARRLLRLQTYRR